MPCAGRGGGGGLGRGTSQQHFMGYLGYVFHSKQVTAPHYHPCLGGSLVLMSPFKVVPVSVSSFGLFICPWSSCIQPLCPV